MEISWPNVADIVVPLLAVVLGAAAARSWERRPRLIAYLAYASGCRITPGDGGEPYYINVHSVVLRNDGSRAATNVRLGHTDLQFNYHVSPDFEHGVSQLPNGGREIGFSSFPPKRLVTITYLYVGATWNQINTHLESDEGPIKIQNVLPTRQLSKGTKRLLLFLLFCGAVSVAYVGWAAINAIWTLLVPLLTDAT